MESEEKAKTVLRIALRRSVLSLFVEYEDREGRQHCKRIHLKRSFCASADQLTNELILCFPHHLSGDLVPRQQLLKVVRPLFAAKGIDREPEPLVDDSPHGMQALQSLDLNKVSDEVNKKAKEIMSQHFEAARLKPGDDGFEYDVRRDFQPTEASDWDD